MLSEVTGTFWKLPYQFDFIATEHSKYISEKDDRILLRPADYVAVSYKNIPSYIITIKKLINGI